MNEPLSVLRVNAGADRYGERRGLGVSTLEFKITPQDVPGVLVIENVFHSPGGPARHFHFEQDEWFYILEGVFTFEVGSERMELRPGDSLLGPRMVTHVWAFTGSGQGRILIAFYPAGKMEEFFREVTKANAMPPLDPQLWRVHGMELAGPPLLQPG